MSNFKPGDRVSYNNEIYTVVLNEGDSLAVKRSGSSSPISIPTNQAKKIFQEGRQAYDVNKKLNG